MYLLIQSIAHALNKTNLTPEETQAVETVLENEFNKILLEAIRMCKCQVCADSIKCIIGKI